MNSEVEDVKIEEIKDGMDGIDVTGSITSMSEVRTVETRFGPASFAWAWLEDDTGKIKLNLWRSQSSNLGVGVRVKIEHGFTKFGELNVGSKGRIIVSSH